MADTTASSIGILAGSGALPLEAAAAISARGGRVHVVMVDDLADAALRKYAHTHVNWAQVGRAMSAFKGAGVRDVVMLGATGRPSFRKARPDWGFIKALPSVLRLLNAGGDDAVLRGLVALFERNGLRICSPAEVAPELLIGAETLTQRSPSPQDEADIARGFALVRALGPYDIGQGAVVAGGRIVAIEAAEGTDRMLARLAHERSGRAKGAALGGVLVKLPKPGQDARVDLPTIGAGTMQNATAAGLGGVAVMAGHVLAAERQDMVRAADTEGHFIVGRADAAGKCAAPDAGSAAPAVQPLTALPMPAGERRNVAPAAGALRALAGMGQATLVILGKRVLSIGLDEPRRAVIARSLDVRRPTRRGGLAAIDAATPLDEDVVRAAAEARLAGILIVRTRGGAREPSPPARLALAAELGLFVVVTESVGS